VFRLVGLSELIHETTPRGLAELFAAVTALGDPVVLFGVVAVPYWVLDERGSTVSLVVTVLLAVAVTLSLKELFGLPRPPPQVWAVAVEPGSQGFPSGHAVGSVAVYGGLVAVVDRFRTRWLTLVAAALIGLIGLSRVVLGVHYLGDVLAGFGVGLLVVGGVLAGLADHQGTVCGLAAAASVPAVLSGPAANEGLMVLGGSLGAAAVFAGYDVAGRPVPDSVFEGAVVVSVGATVLAGPYWLIESYRHPAVALAGGVGAAVVTLLVPAGLVVLDRGLPSPS